MQKVKISEIEEKIGTSCIICNSFIELKYPSYLNVRKSDEYVCEDCKNVILALKQVGVQRILTVLNNEVKDNAEVKF